MLNGLHTSMVCLSSDYPQYPRIVIRLEGGKKVQEPPGILGPCLPAVSALQVHEDLDVGLPRSDMDRTFALAPPISLSAPGSKRQEDNEEEENKAYRPGRLVSRYGHRFLRTGRGTSTFRMDLLREAVRLLLLFSWNARTFSRTRIMGAVM